MPPVPTRPRLFLGLLRRRECLVPTWRGWLLAILLATALAAAGVRGIYGFLALHDPVPGGLLVVEGWAPDYVLAEVLVEFRRNRYDGIYVTGVPMEKGAPLSEYRSFAELSAAILIRLGADPPTVHAVPSPVIQRDRTYATAIALRDHLRARGIAAAKLNVFSVGAHARRTHLLYEKAFGSATRIGTIAMPHRDFEPARWWRSSSGFRTVIDESVAYFYARFLFHPAPETAAR